MNPDLWQISAPNFPARSFASLGLTKAKITKYNQETDVATFLAAGAPMDSALLWPYKTVCTILKGNVPWFTGRLTKPESQGSGSAEGIQYELSGPWWDLEQCTYQQQANFYNNDPAAAAPLAQLTPLVWLGYETADGGSSFTRLTTGQQVTAILDYAITCGANLRSGSIDPGYLFPVSQEKGQTAARLLQSVLRWVPDQALVWDYSTTPPTANLVRRVNARTVSFPVQGPPADSLKLTPRYDLQVPVVAISYQYGTQAGGSVWNTQSSDIWPPGANVQQLGALVASLQLGGGSVTTEKQLITTEDVQQPDNSGNDPMGKIVKWFVNRVPLLQKKITPSKLSVVQNSWFAEMKGTNGGATVAGQAQLDVNGNTLTGFSTDDLSDLPRELKIGSITPWMAKPGKPGGGGTTIPTDGFVHAAKYTIACQIQYTGTLTNDATNFPFSEWINNTPGGTWFYVDITLTDGITQTYQKPISQTAAEIAPAGMARNLYDALALLHWQGDFPIKEQECGGQMQVGMGLNLTGGRPEWAGMLAQIQRITEDLATGTTTASVGPAKHLSADEFLQLLRSWRTVNTLSGGLDPRSTGTNDSNDTGSSGIGTAPSTDSSVTPPLLPKIPWQVTDATTGSTIQYKIGTGTILKSRTIDDLLTISGLNAPITAKLGDKAWIDITIDDNGDGTTSLDSGEVQSGAPAWKPNATDPIEVNSSGTYGATQSDYNLLLLEVAAADDPRDGILIGPTTGQLKIVQLCRSNQLMRLDTPADGSGAGLLCWVPVDNAAAIS